MPVRRHLRPWAPAWGLPSTIVLALVCALVVPAGAQPKGRKAEKDPPAEKKPEAKTKKVAPREQNLDLTGIDLNGRMRTPQLLYFLERANEELERATLEKRSFIPDMVRSLDEEAL
jgi:hypothetical protein